MCAAAADGGALGDRIVNLISDEAALGLANQRADNGRWIARIANLYGSCLRHKFLEEGIVERRLDDDARTGHAHLSLVEKYSEGRCVNGVVEISVFQHDQRILAAHLQRH